jgi:hypothetical protein
VLHLLLLPLVIVRRYVVELPIIIALHWRRRHHL